MLLAALLLFAPLQAMADGETGYPMGRVKWDKVPPEKRASIEALFNDLLLVPEGDGVKKFYITAHEINTTLWQALMGIPVAGAGESTVSGGMELAPRRTDATEGEQFKDSASVSETYALIDSLRKMTGKRFRLPTEAERKWAATSQVIDTIADAADLSGKGFHLVLDTIGRASAKVLVITAIDGTKSTYHLKGLPRVTVEKPFLVVQTATTQISFELNQLKRMHYEPAPPVPTDIERVEDQKDETREQINFSNLPADVAVTVYTLDGKQIYSRSADNHSLSLPLATLKSGIYLVKVNGVTYKIRKP